MNLTFVTLNYNGSSETVQLLKSLQDQIDSDFRVIVVDNGSRIEEVRSLAHYISSYIPSFDLIGNKENLGFSGGNNAGIRSALENGADWVLLINNDAIAEKDFTACIKPVLNRSEGIVGIPLREGSKVSYCGRIGWLRATLPHLQNLHPTTNSQQPITYAIGAGVAIHKKVFEKIGFFDERYFLYFEDADFSARAHRAGVPITIAEGVSVKHAVSTSTKKLGAPLLLRYHWRNAHLFNWSNGSASIRFALLFWSVWNILKQAVKILIMPERRVFGRAILAGIFDFYLRRFGRIHHA